MTTVQTTEKVLTSLEVAEMVGREHKNVMQDIRGIIKDISLLKVQPSDYFIESEYTNTRNKKYPMYLVTKKGCELYGNRMSGIDGTAFAIKYIDRFNDMEEAEQQPQFKIPQTKIEALRALADQLEVNEQLEAEKAQLETVVATQTPMVEGFSVLTGDTDKLHTIKDIANNYSMSAIKFNELLHKLGVQYKQSGVWKLYAKYQGKGYTATPTGISPQGHTYKNMKWTNKGEYFLYNFLKERGYTSTVYEEMFESNLPTEP